MPDIGKKYQFDGVDLTPLFSEKFTTPYGKESRIKIGLKKVEEIPLKINGTRSIIASIQELILENKLISTDGFADLNAAGTITYSQLDAYLGTVKLGRLSYTKPNEELKQLDF